jgi:hypothetical protein
VALLVALTFNPLWQDVRVGNVNALQLGFVTAMLALLRADRGGGRLVTAVYLGALVAFVLFKPTALWIAAALAAHRLAARGPSHLLASAGGALLAAALAIGAGMACFHDADVWSDWFRSPAGMNRGALGEAFAHGNRSIAMWLAHNGPGFGANAYSAALGVAALAVLFVAARPAQGRMGVGLARAFADPWFAASAGVVFTFATSPMVWPHYHLLALVPIAWLARVEQPDAGAWGAWACYAMLSTPLIAALAALQLIGAIDAMMYACWLFLLPGLLRHVARAGRGEPARNAFSDPAN